MRRSKGKLPGDGSRGSDSRLRIDSQELSQGTGSGPLRGRFLNPDSLPGSRAPGIAQLLPRTLPLRVIIRITEKAFGKKCSVRTLAGYRDFTARVIAEANTEALRVMRREMFRRAYRAGRLISLFPGFWNWERKKRLVSYLYKLIAIDLHDAENEGQEAAASWEICISRCFFSSVYTPKTCYVMSGIDAGIICGVFGGGKLAFSSRLTEGYGCCRASLKYT